MKQNNMKTGTVNKGTQCRGKARGQGAGWRGRVGCGNELLAALHTVGQIVRTQGNRDELIGAQRRGLRSRSLHGAADAGAVFLTIIEPLRKHAGSPLLAIFHGSTRTRGALVQ